MVGELAVGKSWSIVKLAGREQNKTWSGCQNLFSPVFLESSILTVHIFALK